MFDRAYSLVCRDAAVPVGHLYVLKDRGSDPAARLAALRETVAQCAPAGQEQIEGLGRVSVAARRVKDAGVGDRERVGAGKVVVGGGELRGWRIKNKKTN